MARFIPALFIFFFPAIHTAGQPFHEKDFDHYTTASGLSHNTVAGLAQDARGYVWIGTPSGLNRFNGSRFIQFHSNDDPASMAAEEINGIAWLDKERLAVMNVGLHIVNTRTGTSHNLFIPYHNRKFQFKFNMISRVKGDEQGNLYVLTRSGFYHYDRQYKLVSRFDYYSEEEVPLTHFYFGNELLEMDDQRLLIISIGGLYIYDKRQRQVKKMVAADSPLLAEFLNYPRTWCLFAQRKKGELFVFKLKSDSLVFINLPQNKKQVSRLPVQPLLNEFHWRSGLYFVDDTTACMTSHHAGFFRLDFDPGTGLVQLDPRKYFAAYRCTSILEDAEQNLWIGTTKGLFRQNAQKAQVQVMRIPPEVEAAFADIRLEDVFVTGDKIYAGTRGEAGMLVFDKNSLQFESHVLFKKNKKLNQIRGIAATDDRHLLLGTYGPLVLFNRLSKKESYIIPPAWDVENDWTSDIYKDRKGSIWISSHHIYQYEPATKHFTHIPGFEPLLDVPFVIEEDREGHIWMACHGLARYNTITRRYDHFIDSFPFIKMPDKQINAMAIDGSNTIWFNSNNNGLTAYDIGKKTFRHFTRAQGLPDDNIASLAVVGNMLWIGWYSGLACMDLQTNHIVSFGKEDGFPDMPVIKHARFFYDEGAKLLYFAFAGAVVRFDPRQVLQKKSPPKIFIENLVLGDRQLFLPPGQVSTSWKQNEIRVTIGTINFSDGNSQRFAYRLLKQDEADWIRLGSQPSFNISGLPAGTHRIQVKVFSPNNRWPEQVHEMTITVLPPVWKKDWFVVAMLVVFFVLLYLLVKWRTNVARRKEMEKTHLEKLKADHYKNQLELEQISHYFSSSLTDKKTEDEVLWDVAQNLIGRMNYEDCMIYLWNEDKSKMIQKAAYGPKGKPEFISSQVFDVLPGQGIVGHVVLTRQPLLVPDTRKDHRYRVDEKFRLSEVCVPIIHNDELLGVIDSEHSQPNYFSERDIKILTTIATLIGNKLKQIESEQSLDAKRKELASINEQLAEAKLSALQAQMNPHFVFNALNSIKRMILDGDNKKASRYLSKFALMIRMTLDHSKEVFVTLDENIEYLRTYLEMEQLRFDDSFSYAISVDEKIDSAEITIPSMMIQPLVENAIWHGLMQSEGNKKILIAFAQDDHTITCTVEDNGIGIHRAEKMKEKTKPPHQSVGLENLQRRIKIINEKFDMNCSLDIADLHEYGGQRSGTRVVLRFNLVNA